MTTKNQAYDNVESKLVTASERRMVTAHGIINKNMMLEERCTRSCELEEAYDIDINPDDIDVTDNVTVVWGIK